MSRGRERARGGGIDVDVVTIHPNLRVAHELIRRAVRLTLDGEGISRGTIGVLLVTDDELHTMNRRFLEHDWQTDVITFPIESDPLEGEVYISLDRAREQGKEYGVTMRAEVCRLAIHGALHLAGHDDATDEERAAMSRREDRYLAMLREMPGRKSPARTPR